MTLVLKNRRENFLQYICLSFLDLYRKDKHIGVGKLITAVPVSQEVRERIHDSASSLLHASMELQTEVDPPLKVVLSSTSTTSVWMPVLLRSLRK